MGFAIAAEAARRGHAVVLIAGPVELADPPGVRVTRVVSADEMFEASVAAFETCDAAVMTAAVCDYRPSRRLPHKLKKRNQTREIKLHPTRDICAHLGATKGHRIVVGFAMEDHDGHAHAESKLKRKHCDAIILNGLANVGSDAAEVEILTAEGAWSGPYRGSKQQIAARLVGWVEGRRHGGTQARRGEKARRH